MYFEDKNYFHIIVFSVFKEQSSIFSQIVRIRFSPLAAPVLSTDAMFLQTEEQ